MRNGLMRNAHDSTIKEEKKNNRHNRHTKSESEGCHQSSKQPLSLLHPLCFKHHDTMNRCHGARYRGSNDKAVHKVPHRLCCPEMGSVFVCCACLRPFDTLGSLDRHQQNQCDDWNALNRIHNGYNRQFHQGLAPPGTTAPRQIMGEQYRLVVNRHGLPPWVIMDQEDHWGPYNPIRPPRTWVGNTAWSNVTFDFLLHDVLNNFPPPLLQEPRPDPRAVAVRRAMGNRNNVSLLHETHIADETQDKIAICNFMEAHPGFRQFFCLHPGNNIPGADFRNTSLYRAKYGDPPGLPLPVHVPLALPNEGVAGAGSVGGVGPMIALHRAQNANVPLHQGMTDDEVAKGVFNIFGTPRRHHG